MTLEYPGSFHPWEQPTLGTASPKASQPSDQERTDILHLNLATLSIFFPPLPPSPWSSGYSSYHRNQSAALQHKEQMSHTEQQE